MAVEEAIQGQLLEGFRADQSRPGCHVPQQLLPPHTHTHTHTHTHKQTNFKNIQMQNTNTLTRASGRVGIIHVHNTSLTFTQLQNCLWKNLEWGEDSFSNCLEREKHDTRGQ